MKGETPCVPKYCTETTAWCSWSQVHAIIWKSQSAFSRGGVSSNRNELSVGIPDRTSREWTAIPMQGEMGIKWNRQTTQISCE